MFDKLESVVLEIPNQSIFCCLNHRPLWDKYPDIISRYTPFDLLSMAQGKVIIDDNRETHRCEMRDKAVKHYEKMKDEGENVYIDTLSYDEFMMLVDTELSRRFSLQDEAEQKAKIDREQANELE